MVNFRNVNENDILKEWFDFREETCLCYADKQDRENEFKKLSAHRQHGQYYSPASGYQPSGLAADGLLRSF